MRGGKDVDTNALYTAVDFHDIGYSEGKELMQNEEQKLVEIFTKQLEDDINVNI